MTTPFDFLNIISMKTKIELIRKTETNHFRKKKIYSCFLQFGDRQNWKLGDKKDVLHKCSMEILKTISKKEPFKIFNIENFLEKYKVPEEKFQNDLRTEREKFLI